MCSSLNPNTSIIAGNEDLIPLPNITGDRRMEYEDYLTSHEQTCTASDLSECDHEELYD